MPPARARDLRRCACLALLLGATGCAGWDDPFQRPGTWQAEGVNEANLAAMVADQSHLVQGVGDEGSPAALSAAAVHRLLTDRVKPLPIDQYRPDAATGAGPGIGRVAEDGQ